MPNAIFIEDKPRIKPPSNTRQFFKRKNCADDDVEVWYGVQHGSMHALVSLCTGLYLASPSTSAADAFGSAGREAFEQITSVITIIPEL